MCTVVRIIFVTPHAILAASLVINRRLFKIASTSAVSINRAERRRAILIDLLIGLGIPTITMVLSKLSPRLPMSCLLTLPSVWFVQGHRFNIYEGVGPLPAIPNTYFQIVLTNGVCIIIGLVSSFYCSMCPYFSNTRFILNLP